MATFRGTVRKNDLEGGFLELVTDGGDVYRLQGSTGGAKPGDSVTVKGKVETGGFGIQMSGPALAVDSIDVG